MRLVVDANILFAALMKDGLTAKLFFEEELQLYTAEFIIEEFAKYEQLILQKTKRSAEEFAEIVRALHELITVIPKEEYARYLTEARRISPDQKDVAYLALALKLQCGIWTNDKALKEQEAVTIFSTSELLQQL